MRVDAATGKIDAVTTGNHDVVAYTATPPARQFAVVRCRRRPTSAICTCSTAPQARRRSS